MSTNGPSQDKREEILREFPFRPNDRWGGKIQLIRSTVMVNGQERVYINKRLIFTESGRYINLPRDGVEEMVQAILAASEPEREYHEALMEEINQRRIKRSPDFESPRGGGRRRGGRDDRGDWR